MEKIDIFLKGLGLRPIESDVFLFLLRSGQATISEIVKAAKTKRSTAYFILEQLQGRKLVKYIQKGSHRYYSAITVNEIKQLLQEQKEELDSRMTNLDELASEFAAMVPQAPDKPRVTYFEGRAGMRELIDHMLQFEDQPNYYIGNPAFFGDAVGKTYHQKFITKRIAKKIRVKSIWTSPYGAHSYTGGEQFLREVRYAPKDFIAPTGVFIYGDCVSLLSSTREGFGVIIHSRDYYETMKSWFNLIWPGCSETIPK
jgi:predicted transcriptional regulator